MNPRPIPPDPADEEQASLWAARIDGGTLSSRDRRALDAWLAAAPGRRELLSSYCQLSADLEQQMPLLEGIRDLPAEEASAPSTARPSSRSSRPLWVGAMLTAAAAVALVLWPGAEPAPEGRAFSTGAAERRSVVLDDGSRVELDAHTRLVATLGASERRVRLDAGRAYFAVAGNAGRPFLVATPAGEVRVTGTRFDVGADAAAGLEVTVAEGSVEVRPAADAAPFRLAAGQRFAGGAVRALGGEELDAALAWRRGEVVFKGATLAEVLAVFARHHGRGLRASPEAGALRFGGRFALDDLDGFLLGLEGSGRGLEVRRDDAGSVLVRRRAEGP